MNESVATGQSSAVGSQCQSRLTLTEIDDTVAFIGSDPEPDQTVDGQGKNALTAPDLRRKTAAVGAANGPTTQRHGVTKDTRMKPGSGRQARGVQVSDIWSLYR